MCCENLSWSEGIRYTEGESGKIPHQGGIYKVLRNDGKERSLTRVYVGKTDNLSARYLEHLSPSESNSCLRENIRGKECYFKFALLSGEENRDNTEDHLLKTGKYQCNIAGQ